MLNIVLYVVLSLRKIKPKGELMQLKRYTVGSFILMILVGLAVYSINTESISFDLMGISKKVFLMCHPDEGALIAELESAE